MFSSHPASERIVDTLSRATLITNQSTVQQYTVREWRQQVSRISRWLDFSYQTLSWEFGDILNERIARPNTSGDGLYLINNKADLKAFALQNFTSHLATPIRVGTDIMGRRMGLTIPTIRLTQNHCLQSRHGYMFAPICFSLMNPDTALVVSYAVLSNQRHSSDIREGDDSTFGPIENLVRYCSAGNTRYGFVLSDQEVVVARVATHGSRYAVEWAAIPSCASGDGVLTAHLGIWSLVLMSLNDNHRSLCSSEQQLPINNAWWEYINPEGKRVYRHRLSMRELFALPSGALSLEPPYAAS